MSTEYKLEEEKRRSQRKKCEKEALNSLRRGDTASAKHYAERAQEIKGESESEPQVPIPAGAWEVKIVPSGKKK